MKKFLPFDEVGAAHDIGGLLGSLHLSKVRSALLWQLLRRFEIHAWFDEDNNKGNPRLVLATFWDMNHVASMPLTELLEDIVVYDNDIGLEKEIVALTELKNLIEQAIAARQQQQQSIETDKS